MPESQLGRIEVAVGSMFSGKSEWLVAKLRVHKIAHDRILAVRFSADGRYSNEHIASHNKTLFRAVSATSVGDIERFLQENGDYQVMGVDEVQFFEPRLADLALDLKRQGKKFYGAGLDTDFLGEPWATSIRLMAFADRVEKLVAVCLYPSHIGDRLCATRTQRLIGGKPASRNTPRILIGGLDSYTARCLLCHEIPD